jgi:hypothetical protein
MHSIPSFIIFATRTYNCSRSGIQMAWHGMPGALACILECRIVPRSINLIRTYGLPKRQEEVGNVLWPIDPNDVEFSTTRRRRHSLTFFWSSPCVRASLKMSACRLDIQGDIQTCEEMGENESGAGAEKNRRKNEDRGSLSADIRRDKLASRRARRAEK